jgi:hypothetical protein
LRESSTKVERHACLTRDIFHSFISHVQHGLSHSKNKNKNKNECNILDEFILQIKQKIVRATQKKKQETDLWRPFD